MRRALVLTDEAARHPFRASLPMHVTRDAPREQRNWRVPLSVTGEDVRGFALAYCACFLAAATYLW